MFIRYTGFDIGISNEIKTMLTKTVVLLIQNYNNDLSTFSLPL